MYKILKMEGRAKRAHMETVHGNIETPVFMNRALQHVSPPRASGRRGRKEDGRTPQVYGLG